MTYLEQLKSEIWKKKREEIIEKHKYVCSFCLNSRVIQELIPGYIIKPTHNSSIFFGLEMLSKREIGLFISDSIIARLTVDSVVYFREKKRSYKSMHIDGDAICVRKMTEFERNYLRQIDVSKFNVLDKEFREINSDERGEILNPLDTSFLNENNLLNFNAFSFHRHPYLYEKSKAILFGLKNKLESDDSSFYSNNISSYIWSYSLGLNVHHKYYRNNAFAWEYPDEALQTFCQSCHKDIHSGQKINHIDDKGNKIGELTCCKRCGGQGLIPFYKSLHKGVCFRCCGARYEEFIKEENNRSIFEDLNIPYDFRLYLR